MIEFNLQCVGISTTLHPNLTSNPPSSNAVQQHIMKAAEFSVFCQLFSELYQKAFKESITHLSHSKAQALSWIIYEETNEMLSYKSLSNFAAAAVENTPEKINPSDATLAILARFVCDDFRKCPENVAWYRYRSKALELGISI